MSLPVNVISNLRNHQSNKLALKWLILIGFLRAQFAYTSHRLTHAPNDLGESCQICASYEHFDEALSNTEYANTFSAASKALLAGLSLHEIIDRLRAFSARASPRAPIANF